MHIILSLIIISIKLVRLHDEISYLDDSQYDKINCPNCKINNGIRERFCFLSESMCVCMCAYARAHMYMKIKILKQILKIYFYFL